LHTLTHQVYQLHPEASPLEVINLHAVPVRGTGQGRLVTLKESVGLNELLERIKNHINIPNIRLALAEKYSSKDQAKVKTVALCAGSGVSVIGKSKADVILTGEMGHHDVLAATSRGTNVILCEHTNTERGYLEHLQKELREILTGVNIILSDVDKDPLVVV